MEDKEANNHLLPTLMNPDFFHRFFEDQPMLAAKLIQTITGVYDLYPAEVYTNYTLPHPPGGFRITVDLFIKDTHNRMYTLILASDLSSNLNSKIRHLRFGTFRNGWEEAEDEEYREPEEIFTVVVCQQDPFGQNQGLYKAGLQMEKAEAIPNNGNRLLLVNGQYRNDDSIGRLMHDFSCISPEKMKDANLAYRMQKMLEEQKDLENNRKTD